MADDTSQPFRFLDLPAEIRTMVYEELFANTILTVSDESNRDICYEFRLYASDSFFSFPNNLPPILTVCKMVREEALPHFSRAVILGVSQGDRLDDASIVNRHIREQYLNHIKVVYLSGNAEGAVSDTLLPKLEELHVFSRAWLDYWNVDYLCDHVRVQVGKWMYWEEIQAGEALRMREAEDRPISYKVLLHFLLKGKYCPKQIQFPCKQCCPQNDGSTSGTVAYDEFINYTEECTFSWPDISLAEKKSRRANTWYFEFPYVAATGDTKSAT